MPTSSNALMAGNLAIRVQGLGKRYRLGERRGASRTLREAIMGFPGRLLRRRGARDDTLWALKDVDLEVKRGEVLGVIGRNGAGKTTLLKILSRITEPTLGRVELHGRVGSLLEVGTGFHPELTGRENVYLNGAILGMRKAEIDRKFDEIVAFAEIERFLDTPVKHYSSGMYVRLAFAVAAHLEPEILLVDEVLAVGDLAFQQKCLGKMGEVAGAESTVLFVSHNLRAVRALCPRTLVLEDGRIAALAPTPEALHVYLEQVRTSRVGPDSAVHDPAHRRGSGAARLTAVRVEDSTGAECYDVATGGVLRFRCYYRTLRELPELLVAVGLRSGSTGELVTTLRHSVSAGPVAAGVSGEVVIEATDIPVRPGDYPLYFWLGNSSAQPFDVVDDLTPPLLVHAPGDVRGLDFEPTAPVGYFSMRSRLVDVRQDEPPRG